MDESINLEDEVTVTDSLTGFTGIVTAHLETIHEPPMYLVENETGHKWLPLARISNKAAVPA